ncbi:solute carrier family 25 member 35 isoform X2 [Hoplias malabaricus]|uniref:solute carrier family 25 member 35 isoform X2 n=1 Tax=Hoplias malabaricus TaxID=27720 RepID=UPI003461D8D2
MEFLLSGVAACGACVFTNPLEVVKTRMQLQGELSRRGSYRVMYRNVFQALGCIVRVEGLGGLQRGLGAGMLYQFFMNGVRLGLYALCDSAGLNSTEGRVSAAKSTITGATSGVIGAVISSPIYLGALHALVEIHRQHGILGLWRGSSAAVPRVSVGSAAQLTTFSSCREFITDLQVFSEDSWLVPLSAGMVSSVAVVLAMTPFDVVSTRLYNQPVDLLGQGQLYRGFMDCFSRTLRTEGLSGLYKGLGASYFRLGPHTILSLLFWDQLRYVYHTYSY